MTNDPRSGGTDQHASHDPTLMAALAADDLVADERAPAAAVAVSCDECRALLDDLRAIARAVRTDLPVPAPRRRDFRLTEEDARRLRGGSPLRRALARLGAPGFAILQPLGGVAAALGVALLVVTSGTLPLGAGAALPMAGGEAGPAEYRPLATAAGAGGAAGEASRGAASPDAAEATGSTTSIASPGAAPQGQDTGAVGDGADADDQAERLALQEPAADNRAATLLVGGLLLLAGLAAVVLRRLGLRLRRPG